MLAFTGRSTESSGHVSAERWAMKVVRQDRAQCVHAGKHRPMPAQHEGCEILSYGMLHVHRLSLRRNVMVNRPEARSEAHATMVHQGYPVSSMQACASALMLVRIAACCWLAC